jgi:hypothetical protein
MTSILGQFPLRCLVAGKDITFEMGEGFTFSNTDPGGFEAASIPLPKDLPDVQRGDSVRLESGLRVVFEGRIREVQRSLGAKTLLQCEGYRAVLKEKLLAEIFVDRDLTRWASAPIAEQLAIEATPASPSGPEVGVAPESTPALVQSFTGPWALEAYPWNEAIYDAHGLPIGVIYYRWTRGTNVSAADPNWVWTVALVKKESGVLAGEYEEAGNLRAAGPGANYFVAASAERYFARLYLRYPLAGGTSNTTYALYWSKLAVYGKGFNAYIKTGAAPGKDEGVAPDPVGYYPSSIAAYAISKCSGVQAGVIGTATQIVVPHASYLTPVPIEQIINDMAVFAGWHWGVWETLTPLTGSTTPRVDFRAGPVSGAPTAWAWRRDCEVLDVRESIENLYDSAKVAYTEVGGVERAVEVSKANPNLEAVGLHRQADLSFGTGTKEAAETWGLIQLDLLADRSRNTGSAQITDLIHDMTGAAKPAWMLRAGIDRLRVPDLPCPDVWGAHNDLPITRVECSGSATGLVTSVEFGNGTNLTETLAAQLQANLTAAG